jgi:hypothetical protein
MELLANEHPSTDLDGLSESTAAARGSAHENTTAGQDLELPL